MPLGTLLNHLSSPLAPFMKRLGKALNRQGIDHAYDNDFFESWADAANTRDIEALRVDVAGKIWLGQEAINPQRMSKTFYLGANGSLATQAFFIADQSYIITGISYTHGTAGTNGSAVTANVTHDTGTQAAGAGTSVQTGTFNCKGTINVVQNAALAATPMTPAGGYPTPSETGSVSGTVALNTGDRLSIVFTGTLTSLAAVTLTVYFAPAAKSELAVYYVNANADLSTQTFHVANRDQIVTGVQVFWGTNFAGGVTLDCTHDTSTNAPGAGNSILSAAVPVDGTGSAANNVVTPALTATATRLTLNAGDRLAVKYSATTTGTGVVVVVAFAPIYGRKEVTFQLGPNGQMAVAQCFFVADRDYEIIDASETHGTAAGGAQVLKVTIDKGTTAPGAGTAIDSTGFNLNATANTVQAGNSANAGTLNANALRNRLLSTGDRLGLNWSGAAQASANVALTVSLAPR